MDAEDFLEPDEVQALDRTHLRFKDACEGCGAALTWIDPAFICSHECTWCPECADDLGMVCPNCSGELSRRPRRTQK